MFSHFSKTLCTAAIFFLASSFSSVSLAEEIRTAQSPATDGYLTDSGLHTKFSTNNTNATITGLSAGKTYRFEVKNDRGEILIDLVATN